MSKLEGLGFVLVGALAKLYILGRRIGSESMSPRHQLLNDCLKPELEP